MPELVRLYLRNVALGLLLSLVFVGALLWLNVANLWHLVTSTGEGPIAVVMLVMFNAVVFSGVQFGIAVMRMAEPEGSGPGGCKTPEPVAQPATPGTLIPVTAGARAPHRPRRA
ncbi:hypothetical protein [Frigidibacter mobilis]|uniref:Uncharacterized protein n=1 Tax=Frigidibacter mobilis TaxID=1335048 RepID=A0A159Z4V8_9RHOB|nr:hypothetical protein [Frigidibacter mobilis]AMY70226.1 hypothetical protein AKL17_2992 [Frigidibacter mobilis]